MNLSEPNYRSYLLRLWRIKENDSRSWRASLENTQTGELLGFEDLDALLRYLHTFTEPLQEEGQSIGFTK